MLVMRQALSNHLGRYRGRAPAVSEAGAVVLHQVIALSEWSKELDVIELREPVERKTLSEVQQTLDALIPGLGTDTDQRTVAAAYSSIDSSPF